MYELTPNKPQKKEEGGVPLWLRISGFSAIILLILIAVLLVVTMPALKPVRPDASITPTKPEPTTAPVTIIRTAWIEARGTCPLTVEYRDLVVPGANLWELPNMPSSMGNVPHASKINILSEDDNWTKIEQSGQVGYIQSFFVVDYDPAQEFHKATGKRYCALCSTELTCEPTDHFEVIMPTPTPTPDCKPVLREYGKTTILPLIARWEAIYEAVRNAPASEKQSRRFVMQAIWGEINALPSDSCTQFTNLTLQIATKQAIDGFVALERGRARGEDDLNQALFDIRYTKAKLEALQ